MRVVVLGGGYAGLACLIDLRKNKPGVELHLVDPADAHLIVTHLHQTLHRPKGDLQRSFAVLGEEHRFRHHRAAPAFDLADLADWQCRQRIPLPEGPLAFDYLLLATGARAQSLPGGECTCSLEDFRQKEGRDLFESFLGRAPEAPDISVVGGGASGLQFLFELQALLARSGLAARLRLINLEERLLPDLPPAFDRYLRRRLHARDIAYFPATRYLGQTGTDLHLQDLTGGKDVSLPSKWTLIFSGVAPSPLPLSANRYGQVIAEGKPLDNIFTAGDCALYPPGGKQPLTAQAAVHQGKQVATNMRRLAEGSYPLRYIYRERGFFVGLGPGDGIGWLGIRQNILRGRFAAVVKKALSAQYEFFLHGIDTYLNP